MFRQRTKKGSDMSRMDKKEKKQMEMEQQAREEALEEELEAELHVQEAQPQEAQPAGGMNPFVRTPITKVSVPWRPCCCP